MFCGKKEEGKGERREWKRGVEGGSGGGAYAGDGGGGEGEGVKETRRGTQKHKVGFLSIFIRS